MTGIVDALASPLPVLGFLMGSAFWLASHYRWRRAGRFCCIAALLMGWALGTSPIADALMRGLEAPYSVVHPDPAAAQPQWVVVLAGGARWDPKLPPTAWLTSSSLFRVAEGVRLQNAMPAATLVLMGGNQPLPGTGHPSVYPEAAREMGADPRRIRYLVGAGNTAAEARAVATNLPNAGSLYLVTEASHLPRALYLFRRAGLNPIAAPAQSYTAAKPASRTLTPASFVPRASNYRKVERVMHEQLALWRARWFD